MDEKPYTHPNYLEEIGRNYPTAHALIVWQEAEIKRLRAHLRALAEAVVDSVSSCDGVVSIEAEHQARLALEEALPSANSA